MKGQGGGEAQGVADPKKVLLTEKTMKPVFSPGANPTNLKNGQCLYFSLSTHKQCILCKSKTHNSIAMLFVITWRDSNPGMLS
jgi:hypothetical protein